MRRVALWAGLALLAITSATLLYLERSVEERFRGHLFALPSQIYSRPLVLLPGDPLDRLRIEDRLERLGYQPTRSDVVEPGQYARDRLTLVIGLRRFADRGPRRVSLRLTREGKVVEISDARGAPLPEVEIEPERIAEIQGSYRVRRRLLPLDRVPEALIHAVVELEDQHFFEHSGLDLWRIGGATLANLRAGRVVQGGSTITQQLVKNFYLSPERTLTRKLHEAAMALILEASHTKEEILEAYLNEIYLGQRGSVAIHGVGEAAHHYFGRDLESLTLAEDALLAGIIAAPGRYSPFQQPDAAISRRNLVLGILHARGLIEDAQYAAALEEGLHLVRDRSEDTLAPYFVDHLRRSLPESLGEEQLEREGLTIVSTLDPPLQRLANASIAKGLRNLERTYPELDRPDDPLQAALVALDARTGEVRALVGGRDFGQSQFNRATQAHRQPGSVFKPVVALAALARDGDEDPTFTLATLLRDEELVIDTADEEAQWAPVNFDGKFRGLVTLREGVERSLNVPMARLGLSVGPERVIEVARRLGIESPLRPVPSLALGAFEVTLLEMTRAYAVFAGEGLLPSVRTWSVVRDRTGAQLARTHESVESVFEPDETFLVTSALLGTVLRGTARGLRARGLAHRVAGKTGTTNEERDAWFIGFNPDLVVGIWVGFDDGSSLGVPASRAALPIFGDFMEDALALRAEREFIPPPGLSVVRVHARSGLRAAPGCPGPEELFLEGTAPVRACQGGSWTAALGPFRWLRDRLRELPIPQPPPPRAESTETPAPLPRPFPSGRAASSDPGPSPGWEGGVWIGDPNQRSH